MACSFGARKVSPTASPIAIMPATEAALSTEIPVQADTPESAVAQATALPTASADNVQAGEIRQWAASAIASSEYGNPDWAAAHAAGAPDVTACADDSSAWASADSSSVAWLELTYATPVKPSEINIFQTYNPGQIVKVELFPPDSQTSYVAYTARPAKVDTCPQKLTLSVHDLGPVNRIRITVDQSVLGLGWGEIDAVELVGVK